MPNVIQGNIEAPEGRFAIVVSRYNESITSNLLQGALETLRTHNVADEAIDVAWVPGTFEIPLAAQQMATRGYVAVLCLGAVIRGETSHDRYINQAVSMGIIEAGLTTGIPVLFGVLTCDTLEQAIHRSGGNAGNKGEQCAKAALEMASLLARLST